MSKALEIECLKQLIAATIASFFRRRCYEDVRIELNFNDNEPIDPAMIDVEKRFNWVYNEQEKSKMEF